MLISRWPLIALSATALLALAFMAYTRITRAQTRNPVPAPQLDAPLAQHPAKETAVFAGGCFWGVQSVFQRVKGVTATTAGYSGGSASTATYDQVTTETTGHAESVRSGLRPIEDHLRQALAHILFGGARPHRAQPPGARRGHILSLRHLFHK